MPLGTARAATLVLVRRCEVFEASCAAHVETAALGCARSEVGGERDGVPVVFAEWHGRGSEGSVLRGHGRRV